MRRALAEPVRTAVKAAIRRGENAGRRRVQALTGQALGELESIYRRAAAEIEREIQTSADLDGNLRTTVLRTLLEKIRARLDGLGRSRDELLTSSLREAARIGVSPFEEVDGINTDLVNVAEDATRFVRTFVAEDGLQLSDRLWRLDRGAREAVAGAVEQAVVQGQSASRAAQEFLQRGEAVPTDVANKVNDANASRVAGRARRALLRTDDERTAYQNALRVFRTEINRAHGQAYQAAAFEHPDVVGTRFLLSPAHPRRDICDLHASVNLYGMGPGVYPKGKNPWPAHPNTLSFTEVVFADEVEGGEREDRISWLQRQDAGTQEAVLSSRKKRAALEKGILTQNEINTPWRVLKKRYEQRGIDTEQL
ncbi:MAG TPA: hypothetical protein VK973_13250 [Arenicellales bacterium]|nr:hypothetical protein [Arenicellales bacterium]